MAEDIIPFCETWGAESREISTGIHNILQFFFFDKPVVLLNAPNDRTTMRNGFEG